MIKTALLALLIPVIPGFMTFTRDLYSHKEVYLLPFIVAAVFAFLFFIASLRLPKIKAFINDNFLLLFILILDLGFLSTSSGWNRVLFDRHKSMLPFYYSLALSSALFSAAFFFAMNLFSKNALKRAIIAYVLVFVSFSAWFLVSNIERGWGAIIFYTGAMFYPTKYSFCSIVIVLFWGLAITFIPDRFFDRMKNKSQGLKAVFVSLLILYVAAISAVPFILKKYKIESLEKEKFVYGAKLTWGCNGYGNIDETVACVEDKFKSFGKKHRYETRRTPWYEEMKQVKPKNEEAFSSIKECHSKLPRGCYYAREKIDSYQDVAVGASGNHLVGNDMMLQSKGAFYPRYDFGFLSNKNDVAVVKENNRYVVYLASLYIINLTEEDALGQVNIMRFVEDTSSKDKIMTFVLEGGYRFFITGKKSDFTSSAFKKKDPDSPLSFSLPDFDLAISTDSREEPAMMFIELGKEAYSFPLEK